MEHRRPNGTLVKGYYCYNCGGSTTMISTFHGKGKCRRNSKLVAKLLVANSDPKFKKPHFVYKY